MSIEKICPSCNTIYQAKTIFTPYCSNCLEQHVVLHIEKDLTIIIKEKDFFANELKDTVVMKGNLPDCMKFVEDINYKVANN